MFLFSPTESGLRNVPSTRPHQILDEHFPELGKSAPSEVNLRI